MHWLHPQHPGRRVRLGYCLNVHPADTFEETLAGMRTITLPLRDRLAARGQPFGVGLYFPARVAAELAHESGAKKLAELAQLVAGERLDPFTYNAFPAGGFHADGLKAGVFRPTWTEPERLAFTLDVAEIALRLASESEPTAGEHLSISTHTGGFGRALAISEVDAPDRDLCMRNFSRAADAFARIEESVGRRVVLALEAEPRANCNDTAEFVQFTAEIERRSSADARANGASETIERVLARHLGGCFDTCHAAVEFEDDTDVLVHGAHRPLGKLQFSSALALHGPAQHPAERERFFALAEPRYLHQVTGVGPDVVTRADDVPQLVRDLADGGLRAEQWLACDEWRCHFHVPVDRASSGALRTTREYADSALSLVLARPDTWGTVDLHVEIETYTWHVLPGWVRSERALVDGLEREYRHVMDVLERCGWTRE